MQKGPWRTSKPKGDLNQPWHRTLRDGQALQVAEIDGRRATARGGSAGTTPASDGVGTRDGHGRPWWAPVAENTENKPNRREDIPDRERNRPTDPALRRAVLGCVSGTRTPWAAEIGQMGAHEAHEASTRGRTWPVTRQPQSEASRPGQPPRPASPHSLVCRRQQARGPPVLTAHTSTPPYAHTSTQICADGRTREVSGRYREEPLRHKPVLSRFTTSAFTDEN